MAALKRERLDDGIEVVRLDRPQARNALDSAALSELGAALAELAADEDLRVGADNLRLAWAGARLGVPVGPARLTPLVGLAAAKDLVFTGRTLGMGEARALGLLHRTAPAAHAEAAAVALARELAAHPPQGMRRLKAMFRELTGAAGHVARENELLVEWQRSGAGLPQGGLRR